MTFFFPPLVINRRYRNIHFYIQKEIPLNIFIYIYIHIWIKGNGRIQIKDSKAFLFPNREQAIHWTREKDTKYIGQPDAHQPSKQRNKLNFSLLASHDMELTRSHELNRSMVDPLCKLIFDNLPNQKHLSFILTKTK